MKATCFIPFSSIEDSMTTIESLKESGLVKKTVLVSASDPQLKQPSLEWLQAPSLSSTKALKEAVKLVDTDYVVVYTKHQGMKLGQNALHRMMKTMDEADAGMVYSDYWERKEGKLAAHPVIEYQDGSLRDDFNFGSLLLYRADLFKRAIAEMDADYDFAGLYDLRLRVSQRAKLVRLPELLYVEEELDTRRSGEKMFDYVDPRNRGVQIEMEKACTAHLKGINAWLEPKFKSVAFDKGDFKFEASVIIPVKNRIKTIKDAVSSVLMQETSFPFNLIVVDNYSTDGTTEVLSEFAKSDPRVIHLIPERDDLGIGGCWNVGINSSYCGKFAIQLDSDDLYIDNNVVQRIVDAFYEQNCAMVVGSYRMVNFKLEEIPPGVIDHKEWTPDNGRNNALRINGLGAPRAFYTPVLRQIQVPNVSYGEDYALGLNISRYYQIGRIYEPLYLCRRWDDNSDASLDVNKMNAHNFYKDKLRTLELWARLKYVKDGQKVD
jgi:hypothetical protein